jgi:hypothetical protein
MQQSSTGAKEVWRVSRNIRVELELCTADSQCSQFFCNKVSAEGRKSSSMLHSKIHRVFAFETHIGNMACQNVRGVSIEHRSPSSSRLAVSRTANKTTTCTSTCNLCKKGHS